MSRRRKSSGRRVTNTMRTCEPSLCPNCQYIGEGDSYCDQHQAIVLSDWAPTEDYMICQQKGRQLT